MFKKSKGSTAPAINPNAGSMDPGIFYSPAEPATPAAHILKPLVEIDPEMVLNPDIKPSRTP